MKASEKQIAFIEKLISERIRITLNEKDTEFLSNIEAAYQRVRAQDQLTMHGASWVIDALLSISTKIADKKVEVEQSAPSIPLGTYTVVLGENDYVTLRVGIATFTEEKRIMVSYLSGADNENSYTGFAFVNANGIKVWGKFAGNERLAHAAKVLFAIAQTEAGLGQAHEEFLKHAEAYAIASGKCARCNRKLTVPASLHRGLGPECANKEGL